jgi:hypothetical protein
MSDGLTLEKMKVNERLISMEARLISMEVNVNTLLETNKTALIILTGNGHPEDGLAFRVKQIESKEEGKKQNSTALWTFLSSLGVLVIADFIHRTFFHK